MGGWSREQYGEGTKISKVLAKEQVLQTTDPESLKPSLLLKYLWMFVSILTILLVISPSHEDNEHLKVTGYRQPQKLKRIMKFIL